MVECRLMLNIYVGVMDLSRDNSGRDVATMYDVMFEIVFLPGLALDMTVYKGRRHSVLLTRTRYSASNLDQ